MVIRMAAALALAATVRWAQAPRVPTRTTPAARTPPPTRCAAFNLGVPGADIPGRLGANDGRENYWTAQRQSAWPIIEGDCG